MSTLPPVIEFKGVSKTFNPGKATQFTALKDINFTIEDVPDYGEFIAIVGPSGCGKSTILNLIQGFSDVYPPSSGEVLVRGRKVTGLITLGKALVGTLTSWYDLMHINDGDVIKRTIFVDTPGVRSTDFGITKRQQEQLYENGRVAATTWLARQKAAAEQAAAKQVTGKSVGP